MRRLTFLVVLLVALPASAQRITLDVAGLAERATEVVDVTLDGPLLRLAAKFLNANDADEGAARQIVQQLEGVYVRSYSFDKDGEYDAAVVERVRAQLGPSWKRIVTVRERFKETTEVYVSTRGEAVTGLTIISAEPRELTLVNIVGPVDLDKLAQLEGQFGVPKLSGRKGRRNHD